MLIQLPRLPSSNNCPDMRRFARQVASSRTFGQCRARLVRARPQSGLFLSSPPLSHSLSHTSLLPRSHAFSSTNGPLRRSGPVADLDVGARC
eukprot:4911325-Pleurochrysis_carterae.AAC.3